MKLLDYYPEVRKPDVTKQGNSYDGKSHLNQKQKLLWAFFKVETIATVMIGFYGLY